MTRSDARDENCVDNLNDLHNLCRAFKAAVGAIEVWNDRGQGIGTGFHIGNGYMITAAHVLDGASRATLAFHDMISRCFGAMSSRQTISKDAEPVSVRFRRTYMTGFTSVHPWKTNSAMIC
ncbi:MAG: hypothetical protein JHC57_07490 [Sphingopyxis sp.]|uniref:hypothetical protein n=1 Tax=Sphingopyxis sp. TaxID=1908224 RepID=UPI001A353A67|nr:hypothetical protein [Sphingopyxis sp.]MBJ7499580.1 hypothetical protein [Sphingopyxis sp.]